MTRSDDNAWVSISVNTREGHPGLFIRLRPGLIFIVMEAPGDDIRDDVMTLIWLLDIWSRFVSLHSLGDISDHSDRVLNLKNEHIDQKVSTICLHLAHFFLVILHVGGLQILHPFWLLIMFC